MALALPVAAHTASPSKVRRLSVGIAGADSDGASASARISADGRRIVFASDASNLVVGDSNGHRDVFVADVGNGRVQRVSVGSNGAEADADSMPNVLDVNAGPAISATGRFVAFQSDASNLVDGDTNGVGDIFVRDLQSGTTRRASVGAGAAEANAGSLQPALSADGRRVAFASNATNLVPGDTNGQADVFVRDLRKGTTTRVSVGARGKQSNGASLRPSFSKDGRLIAFESLAANLAGKDANANAQGLDRMDVFARDLKTKRTQRVSVSTKGRSGDSGSFVGLPPAVSANHRFVVFGSSATNLVPGDRNGHFDAFVRDLKSHRTKLVSVAATRAGGNGDTGLPSISADGRRVAFDSSATNLTPRDSNGATTDVFVLDLRKGRLVAVTPGGNGESTYVSISGDGRVVSFASLAGNLAAGDANGVFDVFVGRISRP